MSDDHEIRPETRAAGTSEDQNVPKRLKLDPAEEHYQLLLRAAQMGKWVFEAPTHRKLTREDIETVFLTMDQLKEKGLWNDEDSDSDSEELDDEGEDQCRICEKFSRHNHIDCPYKKDVPPGASVAHGVQIICDHCDIKHNEVDQSGKAMAPLGNCWKCGQAKFRAIIKVCFECGLRFQHWGSECPKLIKPVLKKENSECLLGA